MTLRVPHLGVMSSMARFRGFRTLIMDHTITTGEQETIIQRLHDFPPPFHIICVRDEGVPAQTIVSECEACEEDDRECGVHMLAEALAL